MIKKQDAERIIKERQGRLDELSRPEIWDRYTRHLECGELKEFKQSCIDDEIIIEALKPYATEKPITHFDLIKAMSVEEMATAIYNGISSDPCDYCEFNNGYCTGDPCRNKSHTEIIANYLESEVQEE